MNDNLFTLAVTLKTAIEDAYTAAGVTLPTRRYVANGGVVIDCDQLVIQPGRLFTGVPALEETQRFKLPRSQSFEYVIWLIRCAPKMDGRGNPPTIADVEVSSAEVLQDTRLLFNAVMVRDVLGDCVDGASLGIEVYGPQGGYVGNQATLRVQVT